MTLRTLNYGNYGIFLIIALVHAGFIPSTVVPFYGLYLESYEVISKKELLGGLWVEQYFVCLDEGIRVSGAFRV